MNRRVWALVLASAAAAVAVEALVATRPFAPIWQWTLGASIVAAAASVRAPATAPPVVASLACLAPVVGRVAIGTSHFSDVTPWFGALLSALAVSRRGRSALSAVWRVPLTYWALVVAVTWPVVFLREIDFSWSVLRDIRVPTAAGGFPAPLVALWIAHVAMTQLAGLLFFDYLWTAQADVAAVDVPRRTILPFAASALGAAALAVYQGFVDLTWLSWSLWPNIKRAAGALMDANASGMLGALWMPGFIALAGAAKSNALRAAGVIGLITAALAVWCSGSRSALLAAAIGIAWTLSAARVTGWDRRKLAATAGASAVVILVGAALWLRGPQTVSPLERLRALPPVEPAGLLRWVWEREGHGPAAIRMVREYPVVGIGIGAFHSMVVDYSRFFDGGTGVPPDNAQNWYRHQAAELGLAGSAGCLVVTILVVGLIARRKPRPGLALPATALKGALLAFGIASLVGVPGQHPAIVMTFWTFVFWLMKSVDWPADENRDQPARHSRIAARVAAALVVVHLAGTLYAARSDLRVPNRAKRFDFDYAYGVDRGRLTGNRAVTSGRAVLVRQAPTRWMKLTIWVEHPDASERPVDTKVWVDGERVFRHRLRRNVHGIEYVQVPGDNKRFVLEVAVDRTFSDPSCAEGPACERGAELEWEFVNIPPR